MLKRTRWGIGVAGAAVLALGLGVTGVRGLDRVAFVERESTPAWAQRIALVDDAIERSQMSRAIYEWREAYGAANRSGGSEGLIAVGDRAVRLAELSSGSGFLTEARSIYMHAAFRARAERSRDAILRIVDAFEKLGDAEHAGQVRRIAENRS
jgi:hypothetical protein